MKNGGNQFVLIIVAVTVVAAGVILMASTDQHVPLKIQDNIQPPVKIPDNALLDRGSDTYYFRVIPPPLPFKHTYNQAVSDSRIVYREPNCVQVETASEGGYVDTVDSHGNVNRTYTNVNHDFSTHCDVDTEQVLVWQGLRWGQLIDYVGNIPDKSFSSPDIARPTRGFLSDGLIKSYEYSRNGHPNSAIDTLYSIKNAVNGVTSDTQDRISVNKNATKEVAYDSFDKVSVNENATKSVTGYIQDDVVRKEVNLQIDGLVQMVQSSPSVTVVPEYGPLAGLVFAIAIAFIIIASTKISVHDKKIL